MEKKEILSLHNNPRLKNLRFNGVHGTCGGEEEKIVVVWMTELLCHGKALKCHCITFLNSSIRPSSLA
ncbi:hypothetical protein KP509_20G078300 [Ceratopteris richardii]|uniref:Uncharacterized protein n=1 Tax=Ceratopteris richardii TaxID=49495 RepID=A0A8T2SIC8_CERRI|nr:hypothetical protein KP509_20G078300 [Ceratopteris richardii]